MQTQRLQSYIVYQLPKVEFFTLSANIPSISSDPASHPTPYKDVPIVGEKVTYDNLSITFLVDEYLENYISLHNWMTGIGFPTDRQEFRTFRDVTSNTPASGKTPPTDLVGKAIPDRALYSDAYLMVLSNKNNPIVEVNFKDVFPVSLGALDFTQAVTDVEFMTVTAEFAYQIYEINAL